MVGRAREAKIGGLAALVATWWLLIAAVVVASLPARVVSAPRAPAVLESGRTARIEQPGMPDWPIPVERAAFDELRRAYRESDEQAIERAAQATAWIVVSHGEAVQVVILEGEYAGQRGWLLRRHISEFDRD